MLRPLLVSLLILAFAPAGASAAMTVTTEGGKVVITGTGADERVDTNLVDPTTLLVSVTSGESIEGAGGCTHDPFDPIDPTTAKCNVAGITGIVANLGAGSDYLFSFANLPLQADGGDGDDSLSIGPTMNTTSSLSGGPGDDVLHGGAGADDIQGGPGTDITSYATVLAPVSVTPDGQPNDGASGEGDNVHSDVENLVGSPFDDQLYGGDAANVIDGRAGADTIDGGGGADKIDGSWGNDTLRVQDGEIDTVDCGDDTDTIQADWNDALTACESVSATSPPPSGPAETPGPPAPQALTATIASKFKAGLLTLVKQLTVKGAPSSAAIQVSCSGPKKGCPFKSKKGGATLTKLFKRAKLKPGAVIEVRVTQAGAIGKVFRFTVRKKKAPKAQTLCLPPGAKTAAAC